MLDKCHEMLIKIDKRLKGNHLDLAKRFKDVFNDVCTSRMDSLNRPIIDIIQPQELGKLFDDLADCLKAVDSWIL